MTEAEVNTISTKYESFRLRDKNRERYLLQSILQYGIREPLQCVQCDGVQNYILLDGFKRLRCSYKLRLHVVPVVSLGTDEVSSILQFIRVSAERSLSTLEQAHFVDELHTRYGLTVSNIAERLERSKAWVSVRLGILEEMSPVVREAVFSDRFPVRSYMYTLRQFTRVNGIAGTQIDRTEVLQLLPSLSIISGIRSLISFFIYSSAGKLSLCCSLQKECDSTRFQTLSWNISCLGIT